MKAISLAALLLTVALAGCSGEPAPSGQQLDEGSHAGSTAPLPPWSVGDHWTYATQWGGATGRTQYIISEETGGNWRMDSNEKTTALYEARFDSAFQGEVRKTDLAGSEEGRFVKFFDFPLQNNKSWNTAWDDASLHVVAHHIGPGKFHMVAHAEGKTWADWTYSNDARWFESINFYDENETLSGSLQLTDNGSDFTGTLYRYELGDWIHLEHSAGAEYNTEFSIGDEWNEVYAVIHAFCNGDAQGRIIVGVNGPSEENRVPMLPGANEPQHGVDLDCSMGQFSMQDMVMGNGPGTWELGFIVGAQNGVASIDFEPRRLVTIPFP